MGAPHCEGFVSRPFVISAIERQTSYVTEVLPDHFTYLPGCGWLWVQKVCFWALRKIGCNASAERAVVTTQTIDADRVVEALFRQAEVVSLLGRERPSEVYMGPDDYMELMGDPWVVGQATFRGQYNRSRFEVAGLNVTVLPWMKGLLVV